MTNPTVGTPSAPAQAWRGGRLVSVVGVAIGLSIMGDSLMYSVLPLAAPALGISLPMVGVLLSVNRLVRLLSNVGASHLYERMGPRLPFLLALVLGALATFGYGIAAGVGALLAARLLWGVAWSGMRQGGYQAVWTGDPRHKGRLTGLLWGLVRLGSAIAVLVGGMLYDRYGYDVAIRFVMLAGAAALIPTLMIRWPPPETRRTGTSTPVQSTGNGWRSVLAQPLQRSLTVAGFFEYLLSGVVVSTTAVFVAGRSGADDGLLWLGIGVATLTGMLHGFRWITDLALGPAVGALSDRMGQPVTALGTAVLLAIGLVGAVMLPGVVAVLCLFLVLLCDGALHIVLSAAASGVATSTTRPHVFIGVFTTTTDAGSALGPLTAYMLVGAVGLTGIYLALGALLVLTVGRYWMAARFRMSLG
jgi:MFS family permease